MLTAFSGLRWCSSRGERSSPLRHVGTRLVPSNVFLRVQCGRNRTARQCRDGGWHRRFGLFPVTLGKGYNSLHAHDCLVEIPGCSSRGNAPVPSPLRESSNYFFLIIQEAYLP